MKIGKVSESVLKRSVLKPLKKNRTEIKNGAGVGEDCAIFALSEGEFATCIRQGIMDNCGLDPERSKWFMDWLITKCINNLAASGAQPILVLLGLLLPPETEESQIKLWMQAAQEVCSRYEIQIAGGDTRISQAVSLPCVTVTGFGKKWMHTFPFQGNPCKETEPATEEAFLFPQIVLPGQDVVVTKWIALEGTSVVAEKCQESLRKRYPSFLVEEAIAMRRYWSVLPEAAVALKSGVCAMHDASEGGIYAALWELAEQAGVGLTIDLKKLPIRQETVEVCEHCGLNPYELASGGAMVMAVKDGQSLVSALEKEGIPAVVVGKITAGKNRIVCNEEEQRYLDRPKTDEIYKILA